MKDVKKELPKGWRWGRLKNEITNNISLFKKDVFAEDIFKYIDISSIDNVTKRIIGYQEIPINDAPSRAKYILEENDIIVATVRPNLNAVAIVDQQYVGCIGSSGFCVIRLRSGHYPQYFFQYLTSSFFVDVVSAMVQGAMYPAINNRDVLNFDIPLPPTIEDQIAIANELERKMAEVEAMRQAALRQKEAVYALQSARLREFFPFKKGERLPAGWRWEKLRKLSTNIQYGISISSTSIQNGYKLLRITDIQNGRVDWGRVPYCECNGEEETKYLLKDGDIVFVRTGATTGKSFLIRNPEHALFASYLIRVQCSSDLIDPDYLYTFFQSPAYWNYISQGARGGTLAGFNATMLSKMMIPLPPAIDEQVKIATICEQRLSESRIIQHSAEKQLEAIEAMPGALLREVFDFGKN